MKTFKYILKEMFILLSMLSIIWLFGYILLLTTILSGCSCIYDLGYISKCDNKIQTSNLKIDQTSKGIEITFPKQYKLFDIVFVTLENNIAEILQFDRYTENYQQVWVLSNLIYFKEVYAKYKDGYCLWKKEFQPNRQR